MEIVPYLPDRERGFSPNTPLVEIINAILYKLKTGVQWRQLLVKALFEDRVLSWQSVYHHYRKWCVTQAIENCWISFLKRHKSSFDFSSVDLDGSHSPAIQEGTCVEYQGRKKLKTTNALYLTDRQGLPLAMSEPASGNDNDLYDIEVQFEVITATLEQVAIDTKRLFLNADAGFDSKDSGNAARAKRSMPIYALTNEMGALIGMTILTKNSMT